MRDDIEFNIEFCQLVEQYPALYDYSNASYSNRNVQDKLWGVISKKVGAPEKECKERWKNIRGRYAKYLKSLNMPSGSAAKTVKEYYLAPYLHYLDNFVKSRVSKSNLSSLESNDIINYSEDDSLSRDSPAGFGSHLASPTATLQSPDIMPLLPTKSHQYTLKDVNKTAIEYFSSRTKETNSEKNCLDKPDTDLAFLQSMLPDMKSMTQAQKRKFKIGVLNLSEEILSEPIPRPMTYSRTSYRSESPYTRTPSSHEMSNERSASRESDYIPPRTESPYYQSTSTQEINYDCPMPSNQTLPYPAPAGQRTQTSRTESPYQSTSTQEINYDRPMPSNQTLPYPAPAGQRTQTSRTESPYQSTSTQEINYDRPMPSNQTLPYPAPAGQRTQTSRTESPYQSTSTQEINYDRPMPSNQTLPYPAPAGQRTQTSRTESPYQSTSTQEIIYDRPMPSNQTLPYPAPAGQRTQTSRTESPYQSTSTQEINYDRPMTRECTGIHLPMYSPVTPATPQSFTILEPSHHNTSNENTEFDNLINKL